VLAYIEHHKRNQKEGKKRKNSKKRKKQKSTSYLLGLLYQGQTLEELAGRRASAKKLKLWKRWFFYVLDAFAFAFALPEPFSDKPQTNEIKTFFCKPNERHNAGQTIGVV